MTIYTHTYVYTNITDTDISLSMIWVQILSCDSHFNRFTHFEKKWYFKNSHTENNKVKLDVDTNNSNELNTILLKTRDIIKQFDAEHKDSASSKASIKGWLFLM